MRLQANAIGGPRAKTCREFLEKHYTEEDVETQEKTLLLAVKALLEVAQSGSKNIEVACMRADTTLKVRACACVRRGRLGGGGNGESEGE